MNTTILPLIGIYTIQLQVSALYVGHHQVVQRTYKWLNKFSGKPDDGPHTGPKHVDVNYLLLLILILLCSWLYVYVDIYTLQFSITRRLFTDSVSTTEGVQHRITIGGWNDNTPSFTWKIVLFIFLQFNVNADMKMSLSEFYYWYVYVDNNWFRALSLLTHLGR